MKNINEQFDELIKCDDDSVCFFPYGGDSHDFSAENCKKFINDKLKEINNMKEETVILSNAIRIVIEEQKVSTSFLQRKLFLGYARAYRVLQFLEDAGIVSEADGAKPRNILVKNK